MDWVKSLTGYYRLLEIATGTDAMEVMFKRADALAGELGSDGFIPDAMLPQLTRKPAQARKIAQQLVDAGLWVRVDGGFLIVDWVSINAELVRLQDRKRRERERKRRDRAASRDLSADTSAPASADSPPDCPVDSLYESERKTQTETAAAAAGAAAAAPAVDNPGPVALPPALEILRAQLDAKKLTARWDTLTSDQIAEIEHLIETHGDAALIRDAVRAFQPNKPLVYATGWLKGWRQLRPPGRLELVETCPQPGHSGTTRHCVQCASEQIARER